MAEHGRQTGIRIRDLLETPNLELELLAGEQGIDRTVTWAHVSELQEPEAWLEGGELLICNGLGLPPDASGQRAFITRLAARGVSGLAIGSLGPPEHDGFFELADELEFPIMRVPKPVPFMSISRLVADCSQQAAQRRSATHLRLFDTLRDGCEAADAPQIVAKLEAISGYELYICTPYRQPLLPGLAEPPLSTAEPLERYRHEPSRLSQTIPGGYIVPIPVAGRNAGFLVALETDRAAPAGLGAIRHMGTIAALLIANLYRKREAERRHGAELLNAILSTNAQEATTRALKGTGLGGGPLFLARLSASPAVIDEVHHRVCDLGVPHLLASSEATNLLAMEDARGILPDLIGDLELVVGVSSAFSPHKHWARARVEAERALDRALARGTEPGTVSAYSPADSPLDWLPDDPGALRALGSDVLDPLREYDREHGTAMLESLEVYFEYERGLSAAAAALFVHKHTLAYRLKRVAEITGRDLNRMNDICVLYLALQANKAASTDGRMGQRLPR